MFLASDCFIVFLLKVEFCFKWVSVFVFYNFLFGFYVF